jgi:methylmalonyl-CoA mutase C-terminal domain/subunit
MKLRVVVAVPTPGGHGRAARVLARALRDAGMEVVFSGRRQTVGEIADTVIQEAADAVGLSLLSGGHTTLVPRIAELLHSQDVTIFHVISGAIVPGPQIRALRARDGGGVFAPGESTRAIAGFLNATVGRDA